MKTIPLGSLVVMVGPSGGGKSTFASDNFLKSEIISTDEIRGQLFDDQSRHDDEYLVMQEAHHRLRLRLERGKRAVMDATNVIGDQRRRVAEIGKSMGVPVIYVVVNRALNRKLADRGWRSEELVLEYESLFEQNVKQIMSGDGIATSVIDVIAGGDDYRVVKPLSRKPGQVIMDIARRGFKRVRVIGDVHGNMDGLRKITKDPDTFYFYMGDLIDYGSDTLEVMMYAAKQVEDGLAISMLGNHEKKIAKWFDWFMNPGKAPTVQDVSQSWDGYLTSKTIEALSKMDGKSRSELLKDKGKEFMQPRKDKFPGQISHGNAVTVNQIMAASPKRRVELYAAWRMLIAHSPHVVVIESGTGDTKTTYGFAHGAMTAKMFERPKFRYDPKKESGYESLVIYGEVAKGETVRGHDNKTYPLRLYNWIDELKPRHVSVVGHAVRSTEAPMVVVNPQGGQAIFVDTGSSKDGKLSYMDLEITPPTMKHDCRFAIPTFGDEHGA